MKPITQKELKEILHYDPDTGLFTRKKKARGAVVGAIVGSKNRHGHISLTLLGKTYLTHRLAFLYMEGEFPPDQVDHINRVRDDNRWCNLRHADEETNKSNMVTNTDFLGVSWHKHQHRWFARGKLVKGKLKHLGSYRTHIAACYARWAYDND